MEKFAAIFMAAVIAFTIGACAQGKTGDPNPDNGAAVEQSV